jgi:hypothetical protein
MSKILKTTMLAAVVAVGSLAALDSPAEAGGFRKFGGFHGGFGHGFGHGGFHHDRFGFGHRRCGFFKFGKFIPCR